MEIDRMSDVLPENEAHIRITYGKEKDLGMGFNWRFQIKSIEGGESFRYQNGISMDTLESEQHLELVIEDMQRSVEQSIRQFVQEEMFTEHVNGEQNLTFESEKFGKDKLIDSEKL